jgi:hypothetical protein
MKAVVLKTMLLGLVGLVTTHCALASDIDDLSNLVQVFLANADEEAAHASFWAHDLVYTSSAGLRYTKAQIMDGFSAAPSSRNAAHDEPDIAYSGEEMDIRVYGDTAVVAFKLVGIPADGSAQLDYFNTGTFLRRDGVWKAIAWQATKIP